MVFTVAVTVNRADAMKPLSNEDLGSVMGQSGVNLYFTDLDATLLQVDDFLLDLTPDTTWDAKFVITDDSNAQYLNLGTNDAGAHSMAFCGSFEDENTPINVNWLGFDIDVGSQATALTGLATDAVIISMTGYGSTAMFWNWDLCQFVVPGTAGDTAYDVFGLKLGELFWAEKYVDPNKHKFMYSIISPLSSFQRLFFVGSASASPFVDSNADMNGDGLNWHRTAGNAVYNPYTSDIIRGNTGIGGELGLRPGGGTLGFFGLQGQEATANGVMFAGDIIDKGDSTTPYPNWKSFNSTYYYTYTDTTDPDAFLTDWNISGEFVQGVHHQRSYTRANYIGQYAASAGGGNFNMNTQNYIQNQIGYTSPTRPMRIEVATSSRNCDGRNGNDTYLIAYLCGHYSRTVYYPDSGVSSMGTSTSGAVRTTPSRKEYILGELRVGRFREADPDRDADGFADVAGADHTGGWAINDISVPYTKIVLCGNRSLVDEVSSASEEWIIPNLDYGDNGTAGSNARLTFSASPASCRTRSMNIATPFNGTAANPQSNFGTDINRAGSTWR